MTEVRPKYQQYGYLIEASKTTVSRCLS